MLRIAEALPEDPAFLTMSDDPAFLNKTSWSIVVQPDRSPEDYRRAAQYAQAACRLVPQESTFISTLGVARYRAGQYREALADLDRSLELNSPQYGGAIPADLAFVAMTQHRLGQNAEALMTLGRLREAMSRQPWSDDDESEAFSDEANALIAGTKPPIVEIARFIDDSRKVVEFVEFSPHGRRILSGSADGTLRLWDRESRGLIRRIDGSRRLMMCRVLARWSSRALRRRRPRHAALGPGLGQADSRVPGAYRVDLPRRVLAPTAAWVIPPAAGRMPGTMGRTPPSGSGTSRRGKSSAGWRGTRAGSSAWPSRPTATTSSPAATPA